MSNVKVSTKMSEDMDEPCRVRIYYDTFTESVFAESVSEFGVPQYIMIDPGPETGFETFETFDDISDMDIDFTTCTLFKGKIEVTV